MRKRIDLAPTQQRFCLSEAEAVVLVGPMGEGKTYAGGARILLHAARRPKEIPLRGAVIRDTGPNLEQHTIPSLQKSFGDITTFRALKAGGWLWTGPRFQAYMFGIDSLSDLTRLQGMELDFIWIEEPAPIIGGASVGVRQEVFDIGIARLRGLGGYKWLQVTMNPADEEHWTYQYFEADIQPGTEVFHIPYRENVYLSEEDRARQSRAFRNRPDLARRYVKGEWGCIQEGVAVTPEYVEAVHRSKDILEPIHGISSAIRLWDGWHNPTCLIAQRTPRGKLIFLDSIRGENIGIRQLIRTQMKPLIEKKYSHITDWRDIGDESMRTPDQSDTSITAAGVIEEELRTHFEPCSNDWEPRVQAMKTLLSTMIDGEPMVQLSFHEKILHQALRGGWHYKKNASGVVSKMPVKNLHSHPGDAFSYGAAKLMPWKMPRCIRERDLLPSVHPSPGSWMA